MKNYKLLLTAMCGCALAFSSCSEEEGGKGGTDQIPQTVIDAFNKQYPDATNVSWSNSGEYAVAKFTTNTKASQDGYSNSAWFRMADAYWGMTETEIPFDMLPQTVIDAFNATEYSQAPWMKENEADMLKRNAVETLYVIEVEKKEGQEETEADLYFTEDGILLKVIFDDEADKDYHEYLPQTPENSIKAWLDEHYPDARIVEVDREDNGTEVEIINHGWKLEIIFNRASEWLYTKTDYERKLDMIETEVMNTLRGLSYYTSDRNIDDAERYDTAKSGTFYAFEIETPRDDVKVYIALDGTLLEKRPELGDDNQEYPVNEDIRKFIYSRYPAARIVDCDYDKGYLEVDIIHEGFEKELKFNGRGEWLITEWEIESRHLPEEVLISLKNAGYDMHSIDDDIDVIDTPAVMYYNIEIEKGGKEYEIRIAPDGTILKVTGEDEDDDD